ncbi:MAG: 4-(cytidine 5'-diphospho)-2-C-methyl-D-erythritol kinase [Gammaproteobacteria bacterium RIFCSPHIGHO2_02_FULL_39_13]|nr:MAG: 4-(cytidine 5'-diphospho)-2-C-methyl-D-erythritol kinase [Gammaproteobacteria bacterium RIFCSPHIGHO2_02_FULL_39_13]
MIITAPAKLNLFLHITGRRDDGYHLLDSLFVFTKLSDVINIAPNTCISLSIDGPFSAAISAEKIEHNLIYQAALLLQKKLKVTHGANIHLTKNIPVGAGLGGGSADAAAVLKALIEFWNISCSMETLLELGLSLGADVPACIVGKPAMVSGVGEIIHPIILPSRLHVLLVNPRQVLSTRAIFEKYKRDDTPFSAQKINADFSTKEAFFAFLSATKNDLDRAAFALLPTLPQLLTELRKQPDCQLARMTGSGPTCFALFPNHAAATAAKHAIFQRYPDYWSVVTMFHVEH